MINAFTSKFFVNKVKDFWKEGQGVDLLGKVNVPSFSLDFLQGTLSPSVTFSRNSSATYFNSSGVLTTATNNVPRFDYDPITLKLKGLLIEDQKSNFFLRSEEFDNASWVKSNASVTANQVTAPDGTLTADKLVEDTSLTSHFLQQAYGSATGLQTYHCSVFVKAEGRTNFVLSLGEAVWTGSTYANVRFNLTNGTGTIISGTPTFSISPVGNGWFRCSVSSATIAGTTTIVPRFFLSNGTTETYTGDGTSGMYFWGAQLELTATMTSYIKTVAATVTRLPDNVQVTTIAPWFNAAQGTLFSHHELSSFSANAKFACGFAQATASSQEYFIAASVAATSKRQFSISNAGNVFLYNVPDVGNLATKMALAYEFNNAQAAYDGIASPVDTDVLLPTGTTTLYIGQNDGLVNRLNGWIKCIDYYPRRLSEDELKQITS